MCWLFASVFVRVIFVGGCGRVISDLGLVRGGEGRIFDGGLVLDRGRGIVLVLFRQRRRRLPLVVRLRLEHWGLRLWGGHGVQL